VSAPVITFLSDYGHEDDFVGVCHGVIASICPEARVIDITHGLRRHDVLAGAIVLRNTLPYMPAGVHLAVVDPEVGGQRRAVALRVSDGRFLVGPDNGLLSLAASSGEGIVEAADIGRSPFRLMPISATFHGRDIFAPVAAALAGGAPLHEAGAPFDPALLTSVELQRPRIDGDRLVAQVLTIDRFGNVELNVDREQIGEFGLALGMPVELDVAGTGFGAVYCRTYADAGRDDLLVYEDAQEQLAVAVNHGSAAERLGVEQDAELSLRIG
jgi:S-adenosyl-L-methionine hydrolase (adenosine-forming)